MKFQLVFSSLIICRVASFVFPNLGIRVVNNDYSLRSSSSLTDEWQGDVVSNQGGKISGCSVQQVGDSVTDWIITIDG